MQENKKKEKPVATPPITPSIDIIRKEQQNSQEEKALEEIRGTTHKTKDFVSGTTKLETKVFHKKHNVPLYQPDIEAQISVGSLRNKEITTIASIDFNEMKKNGVSIPSEKWLTPFDRETLSVASSLYEAGNEFITPKMIFQVLAGNKKNVDMTPNIRDEIISSIDRLMGTIITINASGEVQAGWRQKAEYKGPLLPCKRISQEIVKLNGQEVIDCIQILGSSPLFDYARGINQISRTNVEMLNTPVNNTTENIMLKGYLLRQITSMKSTRSNLKPIIRYDTVYEYLGVNENDNDINHKKKDIRERVKKILSFWVESGLILGFEEEKEGKTIAKVKIIL